MQKVRKNWLDRTEREKRTGESNGACLSQRSLIAMGDVEAQMAHYLRTKQPKRGEPGYVYRGVRPKPDFRIEAAIRWGDHGQR